MSAPGQGRGSVAISTAMDQQLQEDEELARAIALSQEQDQREMRPLQDAGGSLPQHDEGGGLSCQDIAELDASTMLGCVARIVGLERRQEYNGSEAQVEEVRADRKVQVRLKRHGQTLVLGAEKLTFDPGDVIDLPSLPCVFPSTDAAHAGARRAASEALGLGEREEAARGLQLSAAALHASEADRGELGSRQPAGCRSCVHQHRQRLQRPAPVS